MKKLLLSCVLLLGLSCAAAAQTAAADTAAERQAIRTMGADICRQLEQENAKKPLASLSTEECQQLFARLMMTNIGNSPELLARITKDPSNARAVGEQLGRKLGIYLLQECPVSQPLLTKMGAQAQQQYQAASPAEEKLISTMSDEACRDLTPRVKQLQTLKPEQRLKAFSQTMETLFKKHSKEISQLYGASALNDGEKMRVLGSKIGYQTAKNCPAILPLLSDMQK